MSTLGERLRTARKAKGLSQLQLATMAKVDPSSISRIERGEVDNPSSEVLASIAGAVDSSSEDLLGKTSQGDSSPPPA